MKIRAHQFVVALLAILSARGAFAQGTFQNLNFEAANVSGYTPGNDIPIALAVPGWTCSYSNTLTGELYSGFPNIWYDGISLGGFAISINDAGLFPGNVPIQGNYDVTLMGGNSVAAIISQTGLLSGNAATLLVRYSATLAPEISLNGQALNMTPLGGGLYASSISAYAGNVATLSFTAMPGGPSFFTLDDIVLSSEPIPEPSALNLFCLGLLGLGWHWWRKVRT